MIANLNASLFSVNDYKRIHKVGILDAVSTSPMRYGNLKHSLQIELANWIERLRNDPSTAWVFNDWLQENDICNQQIQEAMKFLLMAHGAIVVPSLLKWCGITTYFTKFKTVQIQQKGFSYKITISKRPKFWTNLRLNNYRCYKKLK